MLSQNPAWRNVVLLLPGQGSQYAGMGDELAKAFPIARETFEEASNAISADLLEICASPDRLGETRWAQPAIVTHSVAAFRVIREELGLLPSCAAGHSLGELSALVCCGALPFAETVRLARSRGEVMQAAVPRGVGLMAAVFGASHDRAATICRELSGSGRFVGIANDNSADQLVLSGHREAVQAAGKRLAQSGAVVKELDVSIPSHSPLLESAASSFREAMRGVSVAALQWPVLSSVTGELYGGPEEVREVLAVQMIKPVLWRGVARRIAETSPDAVIEVGPKTVLRDLYKLDYPRSVALSVDGARTLAHARTVLMTPRSAPSEQVRGGGSFIAGCLALAASTPNRGCSEEAWAQAVAPAYDRLRELRSACGEHDDAAAPDQIREAAELTRRIARLKKIARAEFVGRTAPIAAKLAAPELVGDIFTDP